MSVRAEPIADQSVGSPPTQSPSRLVSRLVERLRELVSSFRKNLRATSRQNWIVLGAVLALVGATGAVLSRARFLQKMGPPGLKLVEAKVYDTATNVIGTPPFRSRIRFSMPIPRPAHYGHQVGWLPKDTTFAGALRPAMPR